MQARSRAIKVLDYAMSGPAGTAACETFVDALGLKTLFSSFMGKSNKKQKVTAGHAASEDTAHTLGIVSSLLSNLASDSPARIRLLAKFVENSYEKPEKLLEIRDAAHARLKVTDKEIADERKVRPPTFLRYIRDLTVARSAWKKTAKTSKKWKICSIFVGWMEVSSRCKRLTTFLPGSSWKTMA